jgi:hypothetical protein
MGHIGHGIRTDTQGRHRNRACAGAGGGGAFACRGARYRGAHRGFRLCSAAPHRESRCDRYRINDDDIPHTVASSTKLYKSKALDTHDRFSFTFTTAGTYEYFCSLHPHMTGTVVVEAATGNTAAR